MQADNISPQRSPYLTPLLVLAIVLGVSGWYWQTTAAMVAIWNSSETFAHGYLVLPIFAYLLWRVRDQLLALPIRPFPLAVLGVILMGFGWLLAELASTSSPAQFAMIGMMICLVGALLGTAVLRVLAFPLAFLFFAVPFGDFLIPVMMQRTADFTVTALRLSGVPVYREGLEFVIPSGNWSVVEACSGLRYLIASMMVGCLYAFLTYRSTRKRILFVIVSIVVPLVANWLRAYMIVMLGHISGNKIATGVDHLIYGWLFFGLVMLAMFWIGGRWREDLQPEEAPVFASKVSHSWPKWSLAVAVLAALLWKPLAHALLEPSGKAVQLSALAGAEDWRPQAQSFNGWQPDYSNPSAVLIQGFNKNGLQVGLYIGYYRDQNQGQDRELINSYNQLARTSNKEFKQVEWGTGPVQWAGREFKASTAVMRNADARFAVWHWYWVDGRSTSNSYIAKAYLALAQLRGMGDDSAVVMIYTPKDLRANTDEVLGDFARAMGPSIDQALAATEAAAAAAKK